MAFDLWIKSLGFISRFFFHRSSQFNRKILIQIYLSIYQNFFQIIRYLNVYWSHNKLWKRMHEYFPFACPSLKRSPHKMVCLLLVIGYCYCWCCCFYSCCLLDINGKPYKFLHQQTCMWKFMNNEISLGRESPSRANDKNKVEWK